MCIRHQSMLDVIIIINGTIDMDNNVTFVLTICGRNDLLEKTLDSFFKYNSYPIKRFLIIEDSGNNEVFEECKKLNSKKYGKIKI